MIAMTSDTGFLLIWVAFTLLMLSWVLAVVIWAARSRQFRDQDRARYLALWSGIPDDDAPQSDPNCTGGKEAKDNVQSQ